jgi:hypothetical protein
LNFEVAKMLFPDWIETSLTDAVDEAGQITDSTRVDPRMVREVMAAIDLPKNTETSPEIVIPDKGMLTM